MQSPITLKKHKKMLLKEKKKTNEKTSYVHGLEDNIVKMSILLKVIYRVNAVLINCEKSEKRINERPYYLKITFKNQKRPGDLTG